jgi:hypothetical protein
METKGATDVIDIDEAIKLLTKMKALDHCNMEDCDEEFIDGFIALCPSCAEAALKIRMSDVPWLLRECADMFEGGYAWTDKRQWAPYWKKMRQMADEIEAADVG